MRRSIKHFSYALLTSAFLLPQPSAYAGSEIQPPVQIGTSMEFILSPDKREEFTNFSFQTITASCLISGDDEEGNDIFVEVLRKKGKVNDQPLSTGDNILIHVFNKEVLKISGDSGGKVALTNKGRHEIKAMCTVGG